MHTFTVHFNATSTVKQIHTQQLKKNLCTESQLSFSTSLLSFVIFSHCQRPMFFCFTHILTVTFTYFCGSLSLSLSVSLSQHASTQREKKTTTLNTRAYTFYLLTVVYKLPEDCQKKLVKIKHCIVNITYWVVFPDMLKIKLAQRCQNGLSLL